MGKKRRGKWRTGPPRVKQPEFANEELRKIHDEAMAPSEEYEDSQVTMGQMSHVSGLPKGVVLNIMVEMIQKGEDLNPVAVIMFESVGRLDPETIRKIDEYISKGNRSPV